MTFGLFLFAALHYGFLLLLAATAYTLGARLTRRVGFSSPLEKFVFSTATGLGALATLTFLAGLAGLLHAPVMLLALLAILSTGYADLREMLFAATAAIRGASWWARALTVAVALAGSPLLLLPLYPPTQWDSTSYHLAVADIYAREHAVVVTPYLRSPVFPQLNELLFALAMLLYDDLAAQLIQMLLLLLTGAALISWARRMSPEASSGAPGGLAGQAGQAGQAGIWGAAIWISSPLVMMLGSTGYIELSLACFLTLGAYAFVVWHETRERVWLMLSAALFGFAEGSKYLALFPIMIAGLVLLYHLARARDSRRRAWHDVLAFSAVTALVAGPWHAHIAWHTGNPIWPYAANLLGAGPWPLEHIQSLLRDQFNPGAGMGLKAIAQIPWNLTYNIEKVYLGELTLTPVMLYLLPLALVSAIWNRHTRLLLMMITLYTAFWFLTAQNARYLVHALPLLCLACGVALGDLAARVKRLRGSALTAALICIALALPGYRLAWQPSALGWLAMPAEMPPVTEAERTAFISARVPEYAAVHYLNQTHPGPYTLYSFPHSNLAAYVNGTFVGDWYGPARYDDYLAQVDNPGGMYQFLRGHGVDYVLTSQVSGIGSGHSDGTLLPGFLSGHLKLIYAQESVIYEVTDSPLKLADNPELLTNDKLEEKLVNDSPPGWTLHGAPLLDTTGKQAWYSSGAVGAFGDNWIEQTVPVEPGALYIYRVLGRPAHENQFGVYQVEWLDSSDAVIHTFTRWRRGPVDWAALALAVTAPHGAVSARIHATSTDPNPVWLDHFSFKKLSYQ